MHKPEYKTTYLYYFLLFLSIFGVTSCNSTKHLAENEALYKGATVQFEDAETVDKSSKLALDLLTLARPTPNRKLFSIFRFRLWVNNTFGNGNKERGFGKWMKRKLGEEPVLYKESTAGYSARLMEKYLYDRGYFEAKVVPEVAIKRKHATVTYTATANEQYTIRKINYPAAQDSVSNLLVHFKKNNLFKKGEAYDLNNLTAERTRLTRYIREKGVFQF